MKMYTATAPSAWAPYIVNGDASGMTDEEQSQCDAWLASWAPAVCTDCQPAGFIVWHDARNVGAMAADCEEYTFLEYGEVTP